MSKNKSLLYFMFYNLSSEKKNNKFDQQIKALKNLGYEVWYLGYGEKEIYLINEKEKIAVGKASKLNYRIFHRIALYKAALKSLQVKNNYDFCYHRSMFSTPVKNSFLKKLNFQGSKVIIEIPTYPPQNETNNGKRWMLKKLLKMFRLMEKKEAKFTTLYALIGEKSDKYLGIPAINIENGINVEDTPLRKPQNIPGEIHVLALAKMNHYHGFDRFIEGLYYHKDDSINVILHLVGPDADGSLSLWRKKVKKYDLENKVIFEGELRGKELDDMFDLCDIGLSSLGLYRIDLVNVAVLKAREYMSRGLPFINASEDSALKKCQQFFMNVPNDNSPIDVSKVVAFVNSIREEKDIPERMRAYAKANMSWEKQFEKVFKAIN